MDAGYGVCLTVAYDGGAFSGYQFQDNARSVQGDLEMAATRMLQLPVRVRGAGRTDAGVHALGQRVAFDSPMLIAPVGWIRGLNRFLQRDVVVRDAHAVPFGYDPRHDCREKTYRYLLQCGETTDPLVRHHSWFIRRRLVADPGSLRFPWLPVLDVERMRAVASTWVGRHDFAAFRGAGDDRLTTVRTVMNIEIERWGQRDDMLRIEVTGHAFLKQMVRAMVGTLVMVGRGRFDVARAQALVTPGTPRGDAGITAPAHGLTLVRVRLGRRSGLDLD